MSKAQDKALEFKLWKSRPMMIICLAFSAGLVLSFKIKALIIIIAPVLLILLAGAVYLYYKNINISYIICLVFVLTGWLCGSLSLPAWRNDRNLPGPIDGFGGKVSYIDKIEGGRLDIVIDDVYFVKGQMDEPVDGRIIVSIFGDEGEALATKYSEGTGIFVSGCPELPEAAQSYGMFSAENYYLKYDIRYTAYAHCVDVNAVSYQSPGFLRKIEGGIRQYIISVPTKYIGDAEGGLMAAFMTGNMDYIPYDVKNMFAELGLSHVLAVSGLHIVILLAAWQIFAKKLRIGFVPQSVISAFLVIIFLVTAGVGASISRAVVMWACVILSKVASKQYDGLNVLGFTAFVLLLINPLWILDIGFQLSFISVAALILIGDQVTAAAGKLGRYTLVKLFMATISVLLFTWSVNAYLFNYLPVLAPLSNVIFVPALSAVLAFGFLLVAFSAVPFLALFLGWLIRWYLRILLFALDTMQKININIAVKSPTVIVITLAVLSILLFSNKVFHGRKVLRAIISGVMLSVSIAMAFFPSKPDYFHKIYAGYSCNYILMYNDAGVTAVINEYDGGLQQSVRNLGYNSIENLVFSGNDARDLEYMLDNLSFKVGNIYAPEEIAEIVGNDCVTQVQDHGLIDAGIEIYIEPFKAKSKDAKIHYAVCFEMYDKMTVYLDPMSLREGSFEDCAIMIPSRWSKARAENVYGRRLDQLIINDASGMFAETTSALAQSGTEIYNTNRGAVDLALAE